MQAVLAGFVRCIGGLYSHESAAPGMLQENSAPDAFHALKHQDLFIPTRKTGMTKMILASLASMVISIVASTASELHGGERIYGTPVRSDFASVSSSVSSSNGSMVLTAHRFAYYRPSYYGRGYYRPSFYGPRYYGQAYYYRPPYYRYLYRPSYSIPYSYGFYRPRYFAPFRFPCHVPLGLPYVSSPPLAPYLSAPVDAGLYCW